MFEKIRRWTAQHPNWALACITLAALAPFLAKPFNMDDPMFIWAARQIQIHPANPYGFNVNWYGWWEPMFNVMENPPLNCYYIALVAGIVGWSEIGLHLAFLLPAIAVILGTYRLAKHFCQQPRLAALITLFTPVFLVSASTIMCDVLLLAFWIWAMVFWVEGLPQNNSRQLTLSGILMALALWTHYYGICLIPLLAAHGLAYHRRPGRWIFYLLIPVVAGLAYEAATQLVYGRALFSTAAGYSASTKVLHGFTAGSTGLLALTFTGGCVATAVFFAPLLWRLRTLLVFLGGALLLTLLFGGTLLGKYELLTGKIRTLTEIQIVFWAAGALGVLALALADLWRRRDAISLLLFFWVLGTFIFAGFVNWTVNGRALLPLTSAVAILLVRRLDESKNAPRRIGVALLVGAIFSLLVAQSDCLLAQAVRECAIQTQAQHGQQTQTLWFEGHWGYQCYMENLGIGAVDLDKSPLKSGDLIAVPLNNSNVKLPKQADFADILLVPKGRFLTTLAVDSGAGFYASNVGPLPFALGDVPPERVVFFRIKNPTPATSSITLSRPGK